MKRVILIMLSVLMICSIVFGGCGKPAEETPTTPTTPEVETISWRWTSFSPYPGNFPPFYEAWAKELEEASGGRLKITFYWAESLVKLAGAFDAVASGTADIGDLSVGMYPDRFPLVIGFSLPVGFESSVQTGQTVIAMFNKYKELRDAFLPTRVLWWHAVGPRLNIVSKRPVQTVEDLKGLKIATTSKYEIAVWNKLGAVPVPILSTEQYQALQTGIIDASGGDWNQMYLWRYYEVTKYRTDTGFGNMGGYPALINIDSYNKLPADIKQEFDTLTDPMKMTVHMCKDSWMEYVFGPSGSIEKMKEFDRKQGNPEWYVLPAAEQDKILKAIWPINDQWISEMEAKGLPGKAFVDDLVAFAKQYK